MFKSRIRHLLIIILMTALPMQVFAWADWHESSFELVWGDSYNQFGNQADPVFGGPVTGSAGESEVTTFTFEYSNGWKYGETYLYFDIFFDSDSFNGQDEVAFFTQGWENLSLNKIFKTKAFQLGDGTFVKDLRASFGWQFFTLDDFQAGTSTQAACAAASFGKCVFEAHDTIDVFTGIDIAFGNFGWDGMQFHGLNVGYYHDVNDETDFDAQFTVSYYARANWYWGPTRWQYDGYVQWYDNRTSGTGVASYLSNVFSQHQIKWDAGLTLAGRPNTFFIGTEIQWTVNSFGVDDVPFVSTSTDEFFPALLVEWVF